MHDKRSCLNDRMGRKVFGDNITLWDDVYHPLQVGPEYDGEGLPRQRVLLVETRRTAKFGLLASLRQENENETHRPQFHFAK